METLKPLNAETVNATATVYSDTVDISGSTGVVGVTLIAGDGSGTAEMTVEYECSLDGTNWDTTNAVEVVTALGSATQIFKVTPPPTNFMRLKVTGTGSNPADATITGWLSFLKAA